MSKERDEIWRIGDAPPDRRMHAYAERGDLACIRRVLQPLTTEVASLRDDMKALTTIVLHRNHDVAPG